MTVAGTTHELVTDKNIHFTEKIVYGEMEGESIDFPSNWRKIGLQKLLVDSIWLKSDQPLDWRLRFWTNDAIDADFEEIEMVRQESDTELFYYTYEFDEPFLYEDKDKTSKIHIGLINGSTVSKTAGGAGEVEIGLEIRSVVF